MEHDADNRQDRDGRLRLLINKGAELAGASRRIANIREGPLAPPSAQ